MDPQSFSYSASGFLLSQPPQGGRLTGTKRRKDELSSSGDDDGSGWFNVAGEGFDNGDIKRQRYSQDSSTSFGFDPSTTTLSPYLDFSTSTLLHRPSDSSSASSHSGSFSSTSPFTPTLFPSPTDCNPSLVDASAQQTWGSLPSGGEDGGLMDGDTMGLGIWDWVHEAREGGQKQQRLQRPSDSTTSSSFNPHPPPPPNDQLSNPEALLNYSFTFDPPYTSLSVAANAQPPPITFAPLPSTRRQQPLPLLRAQAARPTLQRNPTFSIHPRPSSASSSSSSRHQPVAVAAVPLRLPLGDSGGGGANVLFAAEVDRTIVRDSQTFQLQGWCLEMKKKRKAGGF